MAAICSAVGVGIITYYGLAKAMGRLLGPALPQVVTIVVYKTLGAVLSYAFRPPGWAGASQELHSCCCPSRQSSPFEIKSGDSISITTLRLGPGKIAVVQYLRLTRTDLAHDSDSPQ
jgi:hypothetical protein